MHNFFRSRLALCYPNSESNIFFLSAVQLKAIKKIRQWVVKTTSNVFDD